MSLLELLIHHMRKDDVDSVQAKGSNPLSVYFKRKYMYDLKGGLYVAS